MFKKFLVLFLFILINIVSVQAIDFNSNSKQIKTILNKHNKALANHDIQNVKIYYDTEYHSSDGFNLDELSQMLEKTYSAYKNYKYKTKIHSISVFDDYAIAQVTDKTYAKVYPDNNKNNQDKIGILTGKSVYNVYFKKINDTWKIIYDDILMEETSLKYGIANKIDINLSAPVFIKEGQDYDLALKINKPDNIIALGSISNEEIIYPTKDYDEKFRKISHEGDLERIVKANKNNNNEYAIASVGFTKVSINEEETKAKIEILGLAYIMKRINMENKKVMNDKKL